MANMLYGKVKLPDIESVWTDKVTYPYVFIHTYNKEKYYCLCTSSPVTVHFVPNTTDTNYSGDKHIIYILESDSISWDYYSSGSSIGGPIGRSKHYKVWANHDIVNISNNTVYLPASDPVDPNAPAATLFGDLLAVFMLGQRLRPGLVGVGRKPTHYKYGDMVALDIDTIWTDKKTYPYAAFCYGGLWISSSPFIGMNTGTSGELRYSGVTTRYWCRKDTEWVVHTYHSVGGVMYGHISWVSHDLYDWNDELSLPASDPIPVYE